MYDKKLNEYKEEIKHMQYIIDLKRHIAMDINEQFKNIHNYLNEQSDINKKLLDSANSM